MNDNCTCLHASVLFCSIFFSFLLDRLLIIINFSFLFKPFKLKCILNSTFLLIYYYHTVTRRGHHLQWTLICIHETWTLLNRRMMLFDVLWTNVFFNIRRNGKYNLKTDNMRLKFQWSIWYVLEHNLAGFNSGICFSLNHSFVSLGRICRFSSLAQLWRGFLIHLLCGLRVICLLFLLYIFENAS